MSLGVMGGQFVPGPPPGPEKESAAGTQLSKGLGAAPSSEPMEVL